jgi:hypothetical protein
MHPAAAAAAAASAAAAAAAGLQAITEECHIGLVQVTPDDTPASGCSYDSTSLGSGGRVQTTRKMFDVKEEPKPC